MEQQKGLDTLKVRLGRLAPCDSARAGLERALAATEQDLRIMGELALEDALP